MTFPRLDLRNPLGAADGFQVASILSAIAILLAYMITPHAFAEHNIAHLIETTHMSERGGMLILAMFIVFKSANLLISICIRQLAVLCATTDVVGGLIWLYLGFESIIMLGNEHYLSPIGSLCLFLGIGGFVCASTRGSTQFLTSEQQQQQQQRQRQQQQQRQQEPNDFGDACNG
jgi:phosphate/sulfate permease